MQSFRVSEFRRGKASELQRDIAKTLAYSDIFDYPLSAREVWRFLIDDTEVKVEEVQKTLSLIVADCKLIDADGEFYFLRGRKGIVSLRQKREKWSKEKIEIVHRAAKRLRLIPWIKMAGITGALAMENCDEDDDIDLMIITSVDRLWLTRLLIFLLCPILGIERRKPKDKKVKNKICFNLFLDESQLKITPENLFVAHEICQVKPLVNKDRAYEKFLGENRWVKNYLPNAFPFNKITIKQDNNLMKRSMVAILLSCYLDFMEKIAFYIQYFYMKPKITREKISLHQAFFHPRELSKEIGKKMKIVASGDF